MGTKRVGIQRKGNGVELNYRGFNYTIRCKGICSTSFINSLHVVPVLSILLDGHYLKRRMWPWIRCRSCCCRWWFFFSFFNIFQTSTRAFQTTQLKQTTTTKKKQNTPLSVPEAVQHRLTTYLRYQDLNDTLQSTLLSLHYNLCTFKLIQYPHNGPEGSSTYD